MRILGIDYGDSRVGVAVSDIMGWTAQAVGTLQNKGMKRLIDDLSVIINQYDPEKIVIGLPKNMDGSIGFRGEMTYRFADELKKHYTGEIVFWDERLSTVSAENILRETNTRSRKRKKLLDTVSACIILEGYMNSVKNR
ncbi:MAG: Holliday junction resolvase RuvX [Clostridia bacterium]|nr:Holliday junction resolvase RuvX [Clostridia bacterium]